MQLKQIITIHELPPSLTTVHITLATSLIYNIHGVRNQNRPLTHHFLSTLL